MSCSLMGKIKDINALSNLYALLTNEDFDKVNLTYLGGFWVLADTGSTTSKEKMCKHVGVASWFYELLPANDSFVSEDRLVWVSVEGLPIKTWTHKTFTKIVSPWGSLSEVEDEEDSSFLYKKLCVITKPYILIDNKIKVIAKGRVYWIRVKELEAWSPDFSNYLSDNDTKDDESDDEKMDHGSGNCPSIGSSGGILCVWDPNMFIKDSVSISDSFLAIRGTWVPTSTKLLIVSVYAPQELSKVRVLWEYIGHLIESWDGECVILGDFNEVRTEQERFGTVFNALGSNAFN
nr:RNA-directed DNA polymerase, eukaryota, nucleotide-binding alpha-beta plait domain protein [Tanacetum cinerariifolium]